MLYGAMGLCVGFRLPLQIASSYKTHKAANGIQRYDYLRSVGIKTTEPHFKNKTLIICKTII